jgi:hypothetical protein
MAEQDKAAHLEIQVQVKLTMRVTYHLEAIEVTVVVPEEDIMAEVRVEHKVVMVNIVHLVEAHLLFQVTTVVFQ